MTYGPYTIGSRKWPGLAKLIEEMGELGQVLGKLIGSNGDTNYWGKLDLQEKLIEEISDVSAALAFFVEHSGLDQDRIVERMNMKIDLFDEWQEGITADDV